MIVVKIELWPSGDISRAREIARMEIANMSALADVSDYKVAVYECASPVTGASGRADVFLLAGHERKQSVFALVGRAAQMFAGYAAAGELRPEDAVAKMPVGVET